MSVRPREWVRAWKPGVPGIPEVFHARFVEHAYPPHTHDAWTVCMVDDGAIRYDLDTRHRGTTRGRIVVLPPHVVHDGRPASGLGFRKRVLYMGTEVLDERLIGRAVDRPEILDPALFEELHGLHAALLDPGEVFQAEERLVLVRQRLLQRLGAPDHEPAARPDPELAAGLRELLDERRFDGLTLAQAGRILGGSPAHLVRCFTLAFGIAPHRYLVGRRIDAARRRLLDGEPVAQVAASVGFHDQAHLTRHFKRHVGTTPARYAGSRRAQAASSVPAAAAVAGTG
jgi:AraC-like DNA-binding protein